MKSTARIAVLPGDGIGPEVMASATRVLKVLGDRNGICFDLTEAPIGGTAIDELGMPLPPESLSICKQADAILFGSVGGPKWDQLQIPNRPEYALIDLRKELECYVNLRFVRTYAELMDVIPIKEQYLDGGVDIVIVRELLEDVYYGTPKQRTQQGNVVTAVDTAFYTSPTVERVADIACRLAQDRRGFVTVVTKPNVLETSRMFLDVARRRIEEHGSVEFKQEIIDAAVLKLILSPSDFDVILTTNQFGDILGDELGVFAGSLGLVASAALSSKGIHLYEPVHGSAPDIAGRDIANPIGMFNCVSLMLRYSIEAPKLADSLDGAIDRTLASGWRTKDIVSAGSTEVSTTRFTDLVIEELELVGGSSC